MLTTEKEIELEYILRNKAHRLMNKAFGKNSKEGYLWRSRLFGNIHFRDMNKRQLLMVIKELKKITRSANP